LQITRSRTDILLCKSVASIFSEQEFEEFLLARDKLAVLKVVVAGERLGSLFEKFSNFKKIKNSAPIDYEGIFSSILNLLEDDDLQRRWWVTAFDTVGKALKNSGDYFGVARIFIDCLNSDVGRLSYSRYLFIYWTIQDYKKAMATETPTIRKFMEDSLKILEQRQQKYHDDWISVLLTPHTWKNPPFSAELFLKHYAENNSSKYQEGLKNLLEDDKSLIGFSEIFGMFRGDNGRPMRYDGEKYATLLPKPLDEIYIKRLPEVISILPDGHDKELLSFMLEALSFK